MTKDEETELLATYRFMVALQFPIMGEQEHKIIACLMLAAVQTDRENDTRGN